MMIFKFTRKGLFTTSLAVILTLLFAFPALAMSSSLQYNPATSNGIIETAPDTTDPISENTVNLPYRLPPSSSASYTMVPLASAPKESGQFTVALSIDTSLTSAGSGGGYFDINSLPVTLGSSSSPATVYHVTDVLVAAAQQYPSLAFLATGGAPITSGSSYMESVSITDVGGTTYNFAPDYGYSYYNGWMFRIDDMFPMLNPADYPTGWDPITQGPVGAAINQAYVQRGETVDLYFADAEQASTATQYARFENASYSSGTLTAQIKTSVAYYDVSNNFWWTVLNFVPLANTQVSVRIDGGPASQYTTNSSGYISISGLSLAAGRHSLTLRPQFFSGTIIPARTSGYIEFTV